MLMKNKLHKWSIGLIFLCSLSSFFLIPPNTVNALTTEDDAAIANHPAGLNIEKYFIKDTIEKPNDNFPFDKNSANIMGTNKDVLVLADGSGPSSTIKDYKVGAYGAIWSNNTSGIDNYININEEQTISAWLYFGPDKGDQKYNGSGMALVLQNDDRGTKAIGMGLQGLGVYGFDRYITDAGFAGINPQMTEPSAQNLKDTSIKNSMALEFDTERNDFLSQSTFDLLQSTSSFTGSQKNYSSNGFDTTNAKGYPIPAGFPDKTQLGSGGAYGHIALSYPGEANSYLAYSIPETAGFKSFQSLLHIDPVPTYLVTDMDADRNEVLWHHITFKWTPETKDSATISYSFNDKNIDGSENTNTVSQWSRRIDKTITVNPKIFDSDTGIIHWGFTGANSQVTGVASKMVVFESIPAMAYGQITSTIKNLENNQMITADDKYVTDGSKLEFNYKLEYLDGRQNWQNIVTEVTFPKNVDYIKDSNDMVGLVQYEDGTEKPFYSFFDLQDILRIPVDEPLGPFNNNSNNIANIKFWGIATNKTEKDIDVDSQPVTATGSNAIASTNTPEFTIGYPKNWTLGLSGGTIMNLPFQEDGTNLVLPTTLEYSDQHAITSDDLFTYKINISGVDKTYTTNAKVDADTGEVLISMTELLGDDFWNIFAEATSKEITLTATDRDNIQSNQTTFTINVIPNKLLSLDVTPT